MTKTRCECCGTMVLDPVKVEHDGKVATIAKSCLSEWRSKRNGVERMFKMVRATAATDTRLDPLRKATLGHDLALIRQRIEDQYNEYGGDEELAALDRVEAAIAEGGEEG